MNSYLLRFDRRAGRLLEVREYPPEEAGRAQDERLQCESRDLRRGSRVTTLLVMARSLADVRESHAEYFESMAELTANLSSAASEALREDAPGAEPQ